MKILVIGNLGYIGPALGKFIKSQNLNFTLIGYDSALFISDFTSNIPTGDRSYDLQYFGDVRNISPAIFKGVDVVVSLAAVSNDPMGNAFKDATREVNQDAVLKYAAVAKANGVSRFVFASSCSVYGFGGSGAKTEMDNVNPLTDYAVSKINSENKLIQLANSDFKVTCLRFATACGVSDRTRLDLVLNDFVWNYTTQGAVTVLSDGSPLRPLIDVTDMSRAIVWASTDQVISSFEIFNCGYNESNFSVSEIADAVVGSDSEAVSINPNALPDKRSYRVDFSKFSQASGFSKPIKPLKSSIMELKDHFNILLERMGNGEEVSKNFMRHETLKRLMDNKLINQNLEWTEK